MTTQTATAPSTPVRSRRRGLLAAPAAAGIAFAVAWVMGLAVWPSNLDVAASGTKIISAYTGHQDAAVTQYLLVEGLVVTPGNMFRAGWSRSGTSLWRLVDAAAGATRAMLGKHGPA
jgi:hypothetical protein